VKRALLLVPLLLLGGCGLTAPSGNPGFVQFEELREPGLRPDTRLSLGGGIFGFAARFVDDDPQTQALLHSLDGVQVQVYEVAPEADREELARALSRTAQRLQEQNWESVVQVTDPDSRVHVLTRNLDDRLLGLAIMVVDEEELAFVNLMGKIAPEQLTALARVLEENDEDNRLARLPLPDVRAPL